MKNKHYIHSYCTIEKHKISLNGNVVFSSEEIDFSTFTKNVYQNFEMNYPKFFKMDNLSKLAFMGAELLLVGVIDDSNENNIALNFSNKTSSLDTDLKHQNSIDDKENYFPSPSIFVYTLPNICLGEISIKYQLKSENCFFIFEEFNSEFTVNYADILLNTNKADQVLSGWVDYLNEDYKAFLYLISKEESATTHNKQVIETLFNS